jgi:hypothetical protein
MITAEIVLARLAGAGVTATVEGGSIRLRHVPRNGAELVDLVRKHKAELLEFFGRQFLPRELWQICDAAPRTWSGFGDCFDRKSTGVSSRRFWQSEVRRVAGRPITLERGFGDEIMACEASP